MTKKKSYLGLLIIVGASFAVFAAVIGGIFLKDYWASNDSAKQVVPPPTQMEKPQGIPGAS